MEKVSVAKGGILVEEKIYLWEIKNFDIIVKNENLLGHQKMIFEFTDSNGHKSMWEFRFQQSTALTKRTLSDLEEDKQKRKLQFSVILMEKRGYCSEMEAAVDVTAEDAVGLKMFALFSRNYNYKTSTYTRRRHWTITKDMLDRENPELIGGTLILRITLKVFTKIKAVIKEVEMPAANDDDDKICARRKEQFYRKIAMLENDKINSDVKIISSDGQEFFAYRWVMSEVSDVFDAMFRSDMKESETGVVKLDDLAGTTVKLLLHFIYTGKVGPQWSLPGNLDELAYAADKYQIEDLKNYLDSNIGKICTVENAGILLLLAKKMSMEQATEDVVLIIRQKCKNADDIINMINNSNNG